MEIGNTKYEVFEKKFNSIENKILPFEEYVKDFVSIKKL